MKKKIGILTFHRADNLGAVLQAYALQTAIDSTSVAEAEIIDYMPLIESAGTKKKISSVKDVIKYIPFKIYHCIKRRGFKKFRGHKLKLTDRVYTPQTIAEVSDKYHAFVTGSDQVWNLECSGEDLTYFLDFADDDTPKISYAASIGQYVYKDCEKERISSLLNRFDKISVREASALKELERIGVSGGQELPDPVVLLDQNQWKQIMTDRLYKGRYILVYMVLDDVNVVKSAEEYARLNGCKVINNKKSIEFILHNSPAEFLSWIFYADRVFTNSFHGTAFSLIFNKYLAADIQMTSGTINNRVNEFLIKTDALSCVIDDNNRFGSVPDAQDKLKSLRKKAYEYIQDVVTL